jgi:hypothetical protein
MIPVNFMKSSDGCLTTDPIVNYEDIITAILISLGRLSSVPA